MFPKRPLTILTLILLLTVVGGGIRWFLHEVSFPPGLVGDEKYYAEVALSLHRGEGHTSYYGNTDVTRSWRPPGQAFAMSLSLLGVEESAEIENPSVLKRFLSLQISLGTILVFLVGMLGWEIFDGTTGVVSAAIASVYPTLIAFSLNLWSETLCAVILVVALIVSSRVERRRSWYLAAFVGVLLGVALLTRELALISMMGVACWWVSAADGTLRKKAVAQSLLMFLTAGMVVFPWTIRNYVLLDRLVPLSTIGWFATAEGNTFGREEAPWEHPRIETLSSFRRQYFSIQGELARQDFARDAALRGIRNEQPWWLVKKSLRTVSILFSPDSFLFKKLSHGSYGGVPINWVRLMLLATVLSYLAVASAAVFGVLGATRRRLDVLGLVLFAGVFTAHLWANPSCRFRVPWLPLVIVFAGAFLVGFVRAGRPPSRWRTPVTVVMLAILFLWCLPVFIPDGVALWNTGHYLHPIHPW